MPPEDTVAPSPTRRIRRTQVRPGAPTPMLPVTLEGKKTHLEKRLRGVQRDIRDAEAAAEANSAKHMTEAQKTTRRPDMLGNRLWMLRDKDVGGRARKFPTPEDLRVAILSYFAWNDTHPLTDAKTTHHQGEEVTVNELKVRPMSITALCLHIGLSRKCWLDYAKLEGYKEMVGVAADAIYTQKFEGASVGIFNPSIMIRDLGLKDRTDITSDDEGITTVLRKVIAEGRQPQPKELEE